VNAQLYDFRPFKTVRDLGIRNGVSADKAISAIRHAQEHGSDGKQIAGQFRVQCWELENERRRNPEGAA